MSADKPAPTSAAEGVPDWFDAFAALGGKLNASGIASFNDAELVKKAAKYIASSNTLLKAATAEMDAMEREQDEAKARVDELEAKHKVMHAEYRKYVFALDKISQLENDIGKLRATLASRSLPTEAAGSDNFEELIAPIAARKVMRVDLKDGSWLARTGPLDLWALYRPNAFIRMLHRFEQEFVDCTVLAAQPVPSKEVVSDGWVVARQTVVDDIPNIRPELGYTLLDGVGLFPTDQEASAAIAELSLPLGWVIMKVSQLLPGWMLPAKPEEAPSAELALLPPVEVEDGRMYIPLPGDWEVQTKGKGSTFRICHVPTGERWMVLDEKLHKMLEQMALDVRRAATKEKP